MHPGLQTPPFSHCILLCDCRYAANYAGLGFVDVTHGCASILTIGNYKIGDEFSRADPTATFPAAAVMPLL